MGSVSQCELKQEAGTFSSAPNHSWRVSGASEAKDASVNGEDSESGQDSAGARLTLLARAIEYEIIPRLMLAHRAQNECLSLPVFASKKVGERDVQEFAKLVLYQDESVAKACVDAMLASGVSVEALYLDLLAPVARLLGELWEKDLCDFTEVTLGLGRLHQVLHQTGTEAGHATEHLSTGRRILLLPCPGEQHTFGLAMVAEFFHRSGWEISGGPSEIGLEPVDLVRREWFDVVGFSLACESGLSGLGDCIRGIRVSSLNPNVGIMVGGPVFVAHPDYLAQVHADVVSLSGREAPSLAEKLASDCERRAS